MGGFRDGFVHKEIAVDVSIAGIADARSALTEGDDVRFRFRISDTTTNSPLRGLYPAAWLDHLVEGIEQDAQSCEAKVEQFAGGSLFSQAEVDLNVYYVLALNDDATISVVDPFLCFGDHSLTMIQLEGPGEDWVLTSDRKRLFVSVPTTGRVAVVDTATWKVAANLDVGSPPRRVALQPDGKYVWVTYLEKPGEVSGVAVFEAEALTPLGQIATGRGQHEIAFSDDSRVCLRNKSGGRHRLCDRCRRPDRGRRRLRSRAAADFPGLLLEGRGGVCFRVRATATWPSWMGAATA